MSSHLRGAGDFQVSDSRAGSLYLRADRNADQAQSPAASNTADGFRVNYTLLTVNSPGDCNLSLADNFR